MWIWILGSFLICKSIDLGSHIEALFLIYYVFPSNCPIHHVKMLYPQFSIIYLQDTINSITLHLLLHQIDFEWLSTSVSSDFVFLRVFSSSEIIIEEKCLLLNWEILQDKWKFSVSERWCWRQMKDIWLVSN